MIGTIRTLSFYAGPIDGVRASLPLESYPDVIVIDGYEGYYEYASDLSQTHHRFVWKQQREQIAPPPPIVPLA